jgi:hypothetical protein
MTYSVRLFTQRYISCEIQKMRFNEEEGSRWALSHELEPPTRQAGPTVAGQGPSESVMPQSRFVASEPPFGPLSMQSQTTLETNNANVHYEDELAPPGEYDALISLKFDPRYQAGQPDIFMDAFWPIPGDSDWMLGAEF